MYEVKHNLTPSKLHILAKMEAEVERINEAINLYRADLKVNGDYACMQSNARGLLRHRIIDLKKSMTRLIKELYQ